MVAFIVIPGHGQEPKSKAEVSQEDQEKIPKATAEKPMSFWMAKKLDYSKSILESLTKGDFEKTAEDAEHLRFLGKMEGFVRRKNPDYRVQLQTFDLAMRELVRQAKRSNAEGSVSAFNQMTTSCVACHVLLREGVE
jgi:hypothetical protein